MPSPLSHVLRRRKVAGTLSKTSDTREPTVHVPSGVVLRELSLRVTVPVTRGVGERPKESIRQVLLVVLLVPPEETSTPMEAPAGCGPHLLCRTGGTERSEDAPPVSGLQSCLRTRRPMLHKSDVRQVRTLVVPFLYVFRKDPWDMGRVLWGKSET